MIKVTRLNDSMMVINVEKIQSVMREQNIKSIKDVAAELIPILKQNDDEINESIIRHLEK